MTSLPPNSPAGPDGPLPPDTVSMGPAPGNPRRRIARPLVVTGVVALVVGAGAGVAVALNGAAPPLSSAPVSVANSTSSPSTGPSAPPVPGRWHGFAGPGGAFGFRGPGAFGALGAVHGEFVVPKSGGGYQTVDTQRGNVTAVSSTSITVKSADGFTKTYSVNSDTIVDAKRDGISSIKAGDQVAIMATMSGGTATAANIADVSNLQKLGQQFFHEPPAPAPSSAPSAG